MDGTPRELAAESVSPIDREPLSSLPLPVGFIEGASLPGSSRDEGAAGEALPVCHGGPPSQQPERLVPAAGTHLSKVRPGYRLPPRCRVDAELFFLLLGRELGTGLGGG